MKRIIIDCDPGNGVPGANVDDGLAIALALTHPEISLELITTVSGNTFRDVGYNVAKNILKLINSDIPVVKGAAQALLEPAAPWRKHLDNYVKKQGLLHLWPEQSFNHNLQDKSPISAAQALGELVCNNPQQITVVAIGPLTNIAHAIQLYPDFVSSVAEIVIMGGVFNKLGYLKDTNFAIDPEAAKIVLTSGANITLAPYDVTTTTMLTHIDLDRLNLCKSPLCQYLVATTRPWLDFSIKTRNIDGCWIHDVICVAYLISPQIMTTAPYVVDVALQGNYARGSSRRWLKDQIKLNIGIQNEPQHEINIIETIDNQKLIDLIFTTIQ